MQKNQAFFIIGSPGSGKDVVIRDITSNFPIIEFTFSQIDDMLSNDSSFKRATAEKRNALLESNSIVVTANSFNLSFSITKTILESIGYATHLIFVESNLSCAIERLKFRPQLNESLNRISIGNSNKKDILGLFESKIIVDNSEILNLEDCRTFCLNILNELSFDSTLTIEDVGVKPKLKTKLKYKPKTIPSDVTDTRGSMGGVWSISPGYTSESIDFPFSDIVTPTATGPLQQIKTNAVNMSSDQDKQRTKTVLGKIKRLTKPKRVVSYGIE